MTVRHTLEVTFLLRASSSWTYFAIKIFLKGVTNIIILLKVVYRILLLCDPGCKRGSGEERNEVSGQEGEVVASKTNNPITQHCEPWQPAFGVLANAYVSFSSKHSSRTVNTIHCHRRLLRRHRKDQIIVSGHAETHTVHEKRFLGDKEERHCCLPSDLFKSKSQKEILVWHIDGVHCFIAFNSLTLTSWERFAWAQLSVVSCKGHRSGLKNRSLITLHAERLT